jgi:hypothetical protein
VAWRYASEGYQGYKAATVMRQIWSNGYKTTQLATINAKRLFLRMAACIFGVLLAAVTILSYRQVRNGGYIWEDDAILRETMAVSCA